MTKRQWLLTSVTRFHRKMVRCPNFQLHKFDNEFQVNPVIWLVLDFAVSSQKRWEIDLRLQLITDWNKSRWPWMTLNANSLLCRQCYVYCNQWQTAEVTITLFSPRKYMYCNISEAPMYGVTVTNATWVRHTIIAIEDRRTRKRFSIV